MKLNSGLIKNSRDTHEKFKKNSSQKNLNQSFEDPSTPLQMNKLTKILSIGYGNMGKPFLSPLAKSGLNEITVVTPNTKPSAEFKHFNNIVNVRDCFDMVIFACKPYQIESVLDNFDFSLYHDDTLFVSILAGTPREYFWSRLGKKAKVAVIMPNLPVKLGKGVLGVLYEERLPMFDPLGKLIYVKTQDDINKITAMFGSGSGFVYHILASYKKALQEMDIDLGSEINSDCSSKELTLGLFEGAIELARTEHSTELETLRKRVMSKKGTTEQGIMAMEDLD
jgi:pyrroline-5-carboxylate reductase